MSLRTEKHHDHAKRYSSHGNLGRAGKLVGPASLGLGQNDFLKLLTTQLQYQNPLEPMSSTDFATQLAQFSTLDGMQQLNGTLGNMMLLQSITQGTNLIGKQITYGAGARAGQGKVDSVQMNSGQLVLMVGGNAVPLSQVQGIN